MAGSLSQVSIPHDKALGTQDPKVCLQREVELKPGHRTRDSHQARRAHCIQQSGASSPSGVRFRNRTKEVQGILKLILELPDLHKAKLQRDKEGDLSSTSSLPT